MTAESKIDKIPHRTRIFYGIGEMGNAIINSAIQFFLMIFYTDGALIPPLLRSGTNGRDPGMSAAFNLVPHHAQGACGDPGEVGFMR